jgi:hypothetical protein
MVMRDDALNGTHWDVYAYDPVSGRLASVQDELTGEVNSFAWNPEGTLARWEQPNSYARVFGYDEEGRLVRIERDYGSGDVQVAYEYGYNSDGVRVWKRDGLAGQEYRYLCRIGCGGTPMRVLRILSILVLCLIMISCRQRVLHLSDPAGWTVVSRELVYKRADGTVITKYVDEKQFRLVRAAPHKIHRTHTTRSQSTVQLIWIDAQGNERPDPPINFPQRLALPFLQRQQKSALIGKPINPENIEMILRHPKQRARRIYESNYCGRRAFVLDFGNGNLSYYDVQTGVQLATIYQGVVPETLQKGHWELRRGSQKGTYKITCE